MADVVQYKLERMLPELDDLEKRGLFSRMEISEIVKQRRKFEYRLKRPSPLKEDFLAYIDYEKNLEKLRLLRKKNWQNQNGDSKKKFKKSVSDFAGISRIVEIYRLATIRFKGDIQLWFQYLEFCRQRRNGRMKKALAQLIRFHPKVPGVWIYAAAWEFDHNLNAAAARALMQSGLRACPTSEDLWVEYLRMELTYLNKLKARKVALGEDKGSLNRNPGADDEHWRDENSELFMALDDKREASDIPEGEEKVDLFREQGLNILRAVYSGAIDALPYSFSLRTRLLEILEAVDLAHSQDMRKEILADMERDFSKEPEYWDWLARIETVVSISRRRQNGVIHPDQLTDAIKVYEEGLKVAPTATMFNFYVKFLMDAIVPKDGKGQTSDKFNAAGHDLDPISHLLTVYERAESVGCTSEDLACQQVSFLLQLGKLDEAKLLAERFCTGRFSDSVQLLALRFSMALRSVQMNSSTLSKADLSSLFELLREVLNKIPVSEAENLWLMALKYFSNHRDYFDKLVETSLMLLTRDGGSDCGFSLSSAIVNYVLQKDGILSARQIYKRFLALPHPGLAIYKNCIELELNLASSGDQDCLLNARKLYESALAAYDQDANLWSDFYSMEVKMGTSESAAAVQWRARKTLKDNVALLAERKL